MRPNLDAAVRPRFTTSMESGVGVPRFAKKPFERRTLHLANLASGAMLAAVVARAKTAAIKDEIAGGPGGLSTARLLEAIAVEARQNEEIASAAGPEGWERLIGRREIGRASVGKECRSRWSPYH